MTACAHGGPVGDTDGYPGAGRSAGVRQVFPCGLTA